MWKGEKWGAQLGFTASFVGLPSASVGPLLCKSMQSSLFPRRTVEGGDAFGCRFFSVVPSFDEHLKVAKKRI
uniref:Uncharacterized protein n=1 Tax=Scophthalmus maximus TaxID=52904 RepID=A0A8D3D202_SCOMX